MNSTSNHARRLNFAGPLMWSTVDSNVPGPHTDVAGQICRVGNPSSRMVFGTGANFFAYSADGGLGVGSMTQITAGFGMTTTRAVSNAHFGFYVAGPPASGAGVIGQYNENGLAMRSFTVGGLTNPVSMASVLAPEPGTMVAPGLGAAALFRRRRPRKKSDHFRVSCCTIE